MTHCCPVSYVLFFLGSLFFFKVALTYIYTIFRSLPLYPDFRRPTPMIYTTLDCFDTWLLYTGSYNLNFLAI